MMEFYDERSLTAKKQHTCELCGQEIKPGERYFRETGKWCGEFFSRALHEHCHFMEVEYCAEVDNEFTWTEIMEYVADVYCRKCPHHPSHDDLPDWTDCNRIVTDCPRIKELFMERAAT